MIYDMKLDVQPFTKIRDGKKSVEIRLYDEKRKKIKAGDSICFTCVQTGEKLTVGVVSVRVFANFLSLFKSDLYDKCGVGSLTAEEAADSMYKYYTREDEAGCGVAAILL